MEIALYGRGKALLSLGSPQKPSGVGSKSPPGSPRRLPLPEFDQLTQEEQWELSDLVYTINENLVLLLNKTSEEILPLRLHHQRGRFHQQWSFLWHQQIYLQNILLTMAEAIQSIASRPCIILLFQLQSTATTNEGRQLLLWHQQIYLQNILLTMVEAIQSIASRPCIILLFQLQSTAITNEGRQLYLEIKNCQFCTLLPLRLDLILPPQVICQAQQKARMVWNHFERGFTSNGKKDFIRLLG
ncbi:hypothetical protein PHMEG_00013636 [Phytophthora megakarya]|uniref:Uncharacterized protein n=1 Tax=Phytophthora megakarya TaxID=4795 RepID=A0A225W8D5_9STRA|nr:hypothetical protein PHMEG_00013636 [Phytophthora megakarya]